MCVNSQATVQENSKIIHMHMLTAQLQDTGLLAIITPKNIHKMPKYPRNFTIHKWPEFRYRYWMPLIRHCRHCAHYYRIFTDGSKEGNRVAAAVVHRDNTKCVRLPHAASIFRAELYALLLAIDVVRPALKTKQFCNLLYHLSLRATWSSLWFIFSAS